VSALGDYLKRLEVQPAPAGARDSLGIEPAAGFGQGLAGAGVWRYAVGLVVAHLLETTLLLASWACIGAGALSGRLDAGWLAAWALALLSLLPLRAANTWLQGVVTLGFGGVLKERLLSGVMALDGDTLHARGSGVLMSEVLEVDAIDELAAAAGVTVLLAIVELAVAPALMSWAAGAPGQVLVLAVWTVLTGVMFAHDLRLRLAWSRQRVALTQRLIENMMAHRTRVAQQSSDHWHAADDAALADYVAASRRLDRSTAAIQGALPRGYVVIACLMLAPSFVTGRATVAELAVSVGTLLFAAAALQRLCTGYVRSAAALGAWHIARPIFAAGAPAKFLVPPVAPDRRARRVLEAHDLSFRHAGLRDPVLDGCSFTVERGERILLEGASGSGKSTLAAILAGSRTAAGGYVLAGGLDRRTLGEVAWRQRIALAPQYHENHIVSGTLLFNLLLARAYPHTAADIEEAATLCEELGLGGLLGRMPSGLNQIVGDTGWRLSQGERSRLFLARALLQKADLIVLDECLAALDPENLRECLECIMRRAPALIVIAHP
jgi:ATP-binding cassette subfamily B protein